MKYVIGLISQELHVSVMSFSVKMCSVVQGNYKQQLYRRGYFTQSYLTFSVNWGCLPPIWVLISGRIVDQGRDWPWDILNIRPSLGRPPPVVTVAIIILPRRMIVISTCKIKHKVLYRTNKPPSLHTYHCNIIHKGQNQSYQQRALYKIRIWHHHCYS